MKSEPISKPESVSLPVSVPSTSGFDESGDVSSVSSGSVPDGYYAQPSSGSLLQSPVPNAETIIQEYSEGGHRGIDFGAPKGTSIVACAPGTVVTSGQHYSYGNYVVIDHGDDLQTLYAHNEENLVEEGQSVDKGTAIATVGTTGNSSSARCHLEVMLNDTLVDPRDYLPEDL